MPYENQATISVFLVTTFLTTTSFNLQTGNSIPYTHSLNINCRVPSLVSRTITDIDKQTNKIDEQAAEMTESLIINTTLLISKNELVIHPNLKFNGSKTNVKKHLTEKWTIEGVFSAGFKTVDEFIVTY